MSLVLLLEQIATQETIFTKNIHKNMISEM